MLDAGITHNFTSYKCTTDIVYFESNFTEYLSTFFTHKNRGIILLKNE